VLNTLPVVVRLSVKVQWIERHVVVEAEVKCRVIEHEGEVLVPSVLESCHQSISKEGVVGLAEGECGLGVL
jgi:hypothetical protein